MSQALLATTASPTETDAAIAEQMALVGATRTLIERQIRYRDSVDQYGAAFRARYHDPVELARLLVTRDVQLAELAAREAPYTGWARYYHVTSPGGHIHSSRHCSSCFPTTEYAWRTDLSGLTGEQVVEREAYNVCSVCLPIAPVEQRAAREHFNRQQREAKAAAKQAVKDAKLVKAAERAIKFLAKVDGVVTASFGSWDAFRADYSLYGRDGRKNLYVACYDLPSTVADYLYDEKAAQEAREMGVCPSSRHAKDPKVIVAEARAKGLIA